MNTEDKLFDIDTPQYGKGPLDAFEASYELDGKTYNATIQAFFENEDDTQSKYKVTYQEGERVIEYDPLKGWLEEGNATSHAAAIGNCISKHFS